jgi:glycosyltransferase involved in cell wall biosynthesis
VLTISESTRRDLLGYRPDLAPERVVVTELAASDRFYPHRDPEEARAIRARYGVPEAPYFLSVATLEPRKNLQHVVRCFARWAAQEKVDDVNLVLVGEKGWGYEELMAEIETLGALRDRVIVTGRAEDEHLAALYSGGLAFAYLSHYEGFGLPPLEAMQCGVPVITSDRSSLPEVVGDAGLLLDPEDTDGLCAAFDRVWKDDDLRARMAAASLERARRFSWRRCLEDTLAAYRRAAAS